MSQPAIFVSYVPQRALEQRRASLASERQEPLVALLAVVFAMGGAVAVATPSIGYAAMPAGPVARVKLAQTQQGQPGDRAVPVPALAIASGDLRETTRASKVAPARVPVRAEHIDGSTRAPLPETSVPGDRDPSGSNLPSLAVPEKPAIVPAGIEVPALEVLENAKQAAPSYPTVMVGDRPIGAITMNGDRIHLASLLGLLKLKMPEAEFQRLYESRAADTFVTLRQLHDAGIEATVDPDRERIVLSNPAAHVQQ